MSSTYTEGKVKPTGLHRACSFQEVEAPRISRQSAHECGKVVRPTHGPPLRPRRYPWYSFLSAAGSTLRS
jgi:hypothetical protein